MPRTNSIASDVVAVLKKRTGGATMPELQLGVRARRGEGVLPHSVRSAVYAHLDENGERLFRKEGGRGGRYFLRG